MKKTTRNILLLLGAVVVIAGIIALLLFTKPTEDDENTSSVESAVETINLFEATDTDLMSIAVQNAEGSYQIIPTPKESPTPESSNIAEASEASAQSESQSFTIDRFEKYNVDETLVTTDVSSMIKMTAAKKLGKQDELDQFELSDDLGSSVTIKTLDGTEHSFVFGKEAGETAGRYVLKDQEVYIVSGIPEGAFHGATFYLNKSLIAIPDLSVEGADSETDAAMPNSGTATATAVFQSLKLSGSNYSRPIEIVETDKNFSQLQMTSPVVADGAIDSTASIAANVQTVTADSAVDVGITDEKQVTYGLKEPYAQIEYTLNGEVHTMKVSELNKEDNTRYIIADDLDVIYKITNDSVSTWAEASVMGLRSPYINLPDIKTVQKLDITDAEAGKDYAFQIKRVKNEEKSTEEKPEYDLEVEVKVNEKLEYDTYQGFYKELIAASVLSSDVEEYEKNALFMSIKYAYFDGGEDEITFYSIEGKDRYAIELNGSFAGLARKTTLDKIKTILGETYPK